MKTTLLVIRDGEAFYRFTATGHEPCPINKASVYTLDQLSTCSKKLDQLRCSGKTTASIRKLTIIEEPLENQP